MNAFGHIANNLLKYPQNLIFHGYLTYVLLHISKTLLFKLKMNEILGIFGYFSQAICYMPNFPYCILYSFLQKQKNPRPVTGRGYIYINNNANTFAIPPLTVYRIFTDTRSF